MWNTDISQSNGTEEKVFENKKCFRGRSERTDRGSMRDRNREFVQ